MDKIKMMKSCQTLSKFQTEVSKRTFTMTEMKLEVVMLPVSDVDRAKAFYVDQVGFNLDHDVSPTETVRVVQLTPSGSGCSIVMGSGLPELAAMQPGSIKGLHLVVADIKAVQAELIERKVDVGEIVDMGGILFAGFNDPDGNSWVLQEIPPGR